MKKIIIVVCEKNDNFLHLRFIAFIYQHCFYIGIIPVTLKLKWYKVVFEWGALLIVAMLK